MFIYAFARANYEKNKIPYCLSYLGSLKYFHLTYEDRFFNIFKKIYFKLFFDNNPNTISINADDCWTDHSALSFDSGKNYVISGYFQGELYFTNIKNKLHELFKIRSKYKLHCKNIMKIIPDVSVHIRRGDYNYIEGTEDIGGPNLTLPKSFYREAIEKYAREKTIAFLSDDIQLVKNWFKDIRHAHFISNSEIIDFQVIMNSPICIISNSTFSWWAAWLNKNEHKKVIAPKYFLGFNVKKEFPSNIIPSDWIQLEVKDE